MGMAGSAKGSSTDFKPKIEEKTWCPELEAKIYRSWEEEGIYKFKKDGKKLFVIDTPPPYPSGRPWHIGAAAHYSQIDMIARTARMMGYNVLFPMGIDRNGLPVELYTERKYGISLRQTSREKFVELCKQALDELEAEMITIMKAMGLSCEFENCYHTDSDEYRRATQATFVQLWEKGLIYEATRPNNYCPECKTTIADAEVIYEELPTKLVYLRFKVVETKEELIVATTRPELLCSCQALIVNPEDGRYVKYHRLHAKVPIFGQEVEVIPHPSARPDFGTGVVMVCSYGDHTDVLLFRELGLKEVIAIDEDGKMAKSAGRYVGLSVDEARAKLIEDLNAMGFLEKVEEIIHRTPICERSRTPIEIIPMKEFYLKQLKYLPAIERLARKMAFHPDGHRQILLNWLSSINIDWPISRRRYYATEIPIWYCVRCGEPHLPKPDRYHRPWAEPPPFERCKKCGSREFRGEERTFDTWMDSSITPLFVTGYFDDPSFFHKAYPTAIRPQAKDIVRTWLYYTVLRCYQLTGKMPFRHAWIMGYGVDEKGERMSKSRGNVIDPYPILQKHGADTFRFWAASEASLGSDFRCSEARISANGKFLTKLWNIARFVSSFPQPERSKPRPTDRWILAELSKLIKECKSGYVDFNFFIPANRIREFSWNLFASHYVEMVKPRAYGAGFSQQEQEAAWFTLHTCLKTILLLLSPITPFITDYLWRRLYGEESVHLQSFPVARWSTDLSKLTGMVINFNSEIWNLKKARGLSLKDPISVPIPSELEPLRKDLIAMHNIII